MALEPKRAFEGAALPRPIRAYNWVVRSMERCGYRPRAMTEASILEAARRRTKLSDFGDDHFRAGLSRLVQSCREDARLHPFGRVIMRSRLVELAVNRLKIQDELTRHPEILDESIVKPLFVTGLPRTGTTLLYNLLGQDPAGRPLLLWEGFWPAPPPQTETRHSDPRIRRAKRFVKFVYWLAPQLPTVHELKPDGQEECLGLTLNTFVSPGFSMHADLSGYDDWFGALSLEERVQAYREYRRQLQLLQWRRRGDHWVLKSPAHLASLDALVKVFPDACVVHTHRDPARAVPSVCSLFSILRGMASDELDPHVMGGWAAERCAELLDDATAARDVTPDRFFDVQYAELVRDPIDTVHRIYDHFGYERSDRLDARMRKWLARDDHGSKPSHHYDLEQFGLDEATIRRLFSDYCERFRVQQEPHG